MSGQSISQSLIRRYACVRSTVKRANTGGERPKDFWEGDVDARLHLDNMVRLMQGSDAACNFSDLVLDGRCVLGDRSLECGLGDALGCPRKADANPEMKRSASCADVKRLGPITPHNQRADGFGRRFEDGVLFRWLRLRWLRPRLNQPLPPRLLWCAGDCHRDPPPPSAHGRKC